MKNQLILFIEEETISVFQKEEKQFTNIRIKGEVFYLYSNVEDGLKFIFDYLLNVLGIHDFSDYELVVFHNDQTKVAFSKIQKEISSGNVLNLEMDIFKTYLKTLKDEFANSVNKYKSMYQNESKLVEKLNESKRDNEIEIKKLKKYILQKEEEFKNTFVKAKTQGKNINDKIEIVRKVILVKTSKNGLFKMKKTDRANVKLGDIIGNSLASQPRMGVVKTDVNATQTGVIFWLAPYKSDLIDMENSFYRHKYHYVVGVISSSKNDNITDINKYIRTFLKK